MDPRQQQAGMTRRRDWEDNLWYVFLIVALAIYLDSRERHTRRRRDRWGRKRQFQERYIDKCRRVACWFL